MKSSKQFKINHLSVCLESNTVASLEKRLPLEPKALSLLKYLAVNNGETHSVDLIQQEVWLGVAVCKHAIYRTIGRIRQVLKQLDPANHYIETVANRGHRLVGEVTLKQESLIFERLSLNLGSDAKPSTLGFQSLPGLSSAQI